MSLDFGFQNSVFSKYFFLHTYFFKRNIKSLPKNTPKQNVEMHVFIPDVYPEIFGNNQYYRVLDK